MTLSSRHRIRNSSPGGLRPSTLPLGHRGSPLTFTRMRKKHFLFISNRRSRRSGESVLVSGQRLRCWPTLKITRQKKVTFFKWVTFSAPASKLNMTLYMHVSWRWSNIVIQMCYLYWESADRKVRRYCFLAILWNSITLTSNVFLELAITMKCGRWGSYKT